MGQPVQAISPRLFFCGCCGRMALILFQPYMKWTWKYICWSAGVQAGCRVFSASMCPLRGTHSGKQQKSGSTCEQCQGTQPWPTHIKRMLARQEFYLPRSRMILVHSKSLQITNNKSIGHKDYHGNHEPTLGATLGPRHCFDCICMLRWNVLTMCVWTSFWWNPVFSSLLGRRLKKCCAFSSLEARCTGWNTHLKVRHEADSNELNKM